MVWARVGRREGDLAGFFDSHILDGSVGEDPNEDEGAVVLEATGGYGDALHRDGAQRLDGMDIELLLWLVCLLLLGQSREWTCLCNIHCHGCWI